MTKAAAKKNDRVAMVALRAYVAQARRNGLVSETPRMVAGWHPLPFDGRYPVMTERTGHPVAWFSTLDAARHAADVATR